MKLMIISGRSGSGKSACLHILEDLGYYCVDGLPLSLLPALVDQIGEQYPRVAISIDSRNLPPEYHRLEHIIDALKKQCASLDIIFLHTDDATLIKRFSETRRKHPLTDELTSLQEGIKQEEELLRPLQALANINIDSNRLSIHQLRTSVREQVLENKKACVTLQFLSFGFKFGLPIESDFMFDVRCLPNPYWEHGLRGFTGRDPIIVDFLTSHALVQKMLADITRFLSDWVPQFEELNRQYLTVAIGCTGGQHRSVYIAEALASHFKTERTHVQVRHRELV